MARQFLGPAGLRHAPLRRYPVVADTPETVDMIREATTIRDEPEVISEDIADITEIARWRQSKQRQAIIADARARRCELSPENRVQDIKRRAKQAHVDLSHETFIVTRDLERARKGGRTPPARVFTRLEGLEALLDAMG